MQSMTGYGKQILQLPNKKITIEIRTLNSRGIDIFARIPSLYRELEMDFRKYIGKSLQRGKIDFTISIELTGNITPNQINLPVVNAYLKELSTLNYASDSDLLSIAMRLPDTVVASREEVEDDEVKAITNALYQTLEKVEKFRIQEGKALEKDFRLRIQNIQSYLEKIENIDQERIKRLRERLRKAVSDLKENIDENRFEQELIFYIERYDITEEKIRLQNHLDYFLQTLDNKESNGKKIGFISQEMGREINTIGSKANDSSLQKLVIQMKEELEKIKEQSLNIV